MCRRSAAKSRRRCAFSRCRARAARRSRRSDFDTLAARQPGDRLLFERTIEPDDIAAYVHSGGTTGSPKLVRLTHRGFSYKCWANAVVMAHTRRRRDLRRLSRCSTSPAFSRAVISPSRIGMSIVIPSPLGARDKRFIENYWRFVEKFGITHLLRRADHAGAARQERAARRAARHAARLCLHRLDRVSGRGRAPDREPDRRARAADLRRDRVHPERDAGAARRRSEIRLARPPAARTRRSRPSSSTATASSATAASTRSAWWW